MSAGRVHLDSFSGKVMDLPKGRRSADDVLEVLRHSPRVSVWDLSETPWLRYAISDLKQLGAIKDDNTAAYPWCRYIVIDRPAAPNKQGA